MKSPGRLLVLLTLLLLSLIWGTTWAAIRIGLEGVPPFTGVALRFALASVVLLPLGWLYGVKYGTTRREWVLWIVNGVLSFSVSYGIVYWCEQRVPSGLTAVLFATFPLFVAILARFLLPEESSSRPLLAGTLLGFAGVAVIYSEDLSKLGGPGVALASVLMLVSPFVSAVASVAIKRWGRGIHPLSITAVPMALGAILMGCVAALTERGRPLDWNGWSIGALLYLALAGSAVTFSLYYWLLSHIAATQVALIAYLSPVIAVTIGALFLHEPYTAKTLVGSALVIGGVFLAAGPLRRVFVRATGTTAVLLALLGAPSPVARAEESLGLRFPADPLPPAVRALGALDRILAFTLSADQTLAAAAFEAPGKEKSIVRVAPSETGTRDLEVDGRVRALRFASEGGILYMIVTEEPTRLEAGDASLRRFDPGSSRARRTARLPLTARGMDLTAEGDALVVASLNELRVILVPDLRSSRLFRIEGENLSVATLPGSSRALVGRKGDIVLVDLSDAQTHDGLPVRARLEMPGPVVSLAASPDGSTALARLEDGRTWIVSSDPLAAREAGVSTAIAWPGYPTPSPPPSPSPAPAPEPPVASPPPAPPPTPSPEPSPVPEPTRAERAEASPISTAAGATIGGRVVGPAAAEARAVVILGPDNLLREAARAVPSSDGAWSAGPFPKGRYRIVVDAGPDRVAVSDPPFATVVVETAPLVVAPDLKLLSVRKP